MSEATVNTTSPTISETKERGDPAAGNWSMVRNATINGGAAGRQTHNNRTYSAHTPTKPRATRAAITPVYAVVDLNNQT